MMRRRGSSPESAAEDDEEPEMRSLSARISSGRLAITKVSLSPHFPIFPRRPKETTLKSEENGGKTAILFLLSLGPRVRSAK